jgi:hypothetical protein
MPAGVTSTLPDAIAVVRKACRLFPSSRIVEHEALMLQLGAMAARKWT